MPDVRRLAGLLASASGDFRHYFTEILLGVLTEYHTKSILYLYAQKAIFFLRNFKGFVNFL
jgi:hypothetical protein